VLLLDFALLEWLTLSKFKMRANGCDHKEKGIVILELRSTALMFTKLHAWSVGDALIMVR
jgi:hypothetical protein